MFEIPAKGRKRHFKFEISTNLIIFEFKKSFKTMYDLHGIDLSLLIMLDTWNISI